MPNLYAAEWLLQIVQAITLAIFPVVVETSDGEKIRGDFKGITTNTLLIEANGSVQELPFDKLASMQRTEFTPKVASNAGDIDQWLSNLCRPTEV